MYEHYFRLTRAPFSLALEPDFLLPTAAHKEALAALAYAISSQKGFVVLTGEVGTGKSTVIRSVLRTLVANHGDSFRFSLIVNPNVSADDLLEFVLWGLGVRDIPAGRAQRLIRFQQLLLQAKKANQICAVIIDEAQQLSPEALEEIRLWTNLETSESKLLQVVLAGQTELDETLNRPELRQLKQRIAFRTRFSPMARREVRTYIDHRWNIAGGEPPAPFTPQAIEAVAFWSNGIPRLINTICDNALLTAFAAEAREVTAREVNEAAADLDFRVSGTIPLEPEQAYGRAAAYGRAVKEERVDRREQDAPTAAVMAAAANGNLPGKTPTFAPIGSEGVFKRWALRLGWGKS
jgi:general secretion pathway protein A